jgi:hypothetical protein
MCHRIRLLRIAVDGKVTEMQDARTRFELLQATAQSMASSLARYCDQAEKVARSLYRDDEVQK